MGTFIRLGHIGTAIVGLVQFVTGLWLLQCIMKNEHVTKIDTEFNYKQRTLYLEWATSTSIGISVGIFQVLFGAAYNLCGTTTTGAQDSNIWMFSSFLLHGVYLTSLFSSIYTSISTSIWHVPEAGLATAFVVFEIGNLILVLGIIWLLNREQMYGSQIRRHFISWTEFKTKIVQEIIYFQCPCRTQTRERLV